MPALAPISSCSSCSSSSSSSSVSFSSPHPATPLRGIAIHRAMVADAPRPSCERAAPHPDADDYGTNSPEVLHHIAPADASAASDCDSDADSVTSASSSSFSTSTAFSRASSVSSVGSARSLVRRFNKLRRTSISNRTSSSSRASGTPKGTRGCCSSSTCAKVYEYPSEIAQRLSRMSHAACRGCGCDSAKPNHTMRSLCKKFAQLVVKPVASAFASAATEKAFSFPHLFVPGVADDDNEKTDDDDFDGDFSEKVDYWTSAFELLGNDDTILSEEVDVLVDDTSVKDLDYFMQEILGAPPLTLSADDKMSVEPAKDVHPSPTHLALTDISRQYTTPSTSTPYTTISIATPCTAASSTDEVATLTHKYTTFFAQQTLLREGYVGELDTVEALAAFNELLRVQTATVDIAVEPAFASRVDELVMHKAEGVHAPAAALAMVGVYSGPEYLNGSPLQQNDLDCEDDADAIDDRLSLSLSLSLSSVLSMPEHESGNLLRQFSEIEGMQLVFPGLSSGTHEASNGAGNVQDAIYKIPTGPNDPMSISRLTNPNPPAASSDGAAASSSTAASSAARSASSSSSSYYGASSINSLLASAAASTDPYSSFRMPIRPLSASPPRKARTTAEDEEEEDGSDSATSSNYTTTTTVSFGSGTADHSAVPPHPNYDTHPVLKMRREPLLPSRRGNDMHSAPSMTAMLPPLHMHPMPSASMLPPSSASSQSGTSGTSGTPSGSANGSVGTGGRLRVRSRKQQCPDCAGWYSNLVAHRSTHLAFSSRPHSCTICGRGFSRPNDLLRHQKSHEGEAPFACPFHAADTRCHSSGRFSRCDTYKNHLKAVHFEYPAGTKKKERAGAGGKCKGCLHTFDNADDWIAVHIEGGRCAGLR
ncbi:uncharacterized protein V1518DRAFT_431560 [Limtongia smithiae]|uniref:uncharacterized protein n=1 Tax=Limtongia smithiae TaxID=1125753 RepID=UPI0034CE3CCF